MSQIMTTFSFSLRKDSYFPHRFQFLLTMLLLGLVGTFPEKCEGLQCYQCLDHHQTCFPREIRNISNDVEVVKGKIKTVECHHSTSNCIFIKWPHHLPRVGCSNKEVGECFRANGYDFGCHDIDLHNEEQLGPCIQKLWDEASAKLNVPGRSVVATESEWVGIRVCLCNSNLCNGKNEGGRGHKGTQLDHTSSNKSREHSNSSSIHPAHSNSSGVSMKHSNKTGGGGQPHSNSTSQNKKNKPPPPHLHSHSIKKIERGTRHHSHHAKGRSGEEKPVLGVRYGLLYRYNSAGRNRRIPFWKAVTLLFSNLVGKDGTNGYGNCLVFLMAGVAIFLSYLNLQIINTKIL